MNSYQILLSPNTFRRKDQEIFLNRAGKQTYPCICNIKTEGLSCRLECNTSFSTTLRKFMNERGVAYLAISHSRELLSHSHEYQDQTCNTAVIKDGIYRQRHLAKIKYSKPSKTLNALLTLAFFTTIAKA